MNPLVTYYLGLRQLCGPRRGDFMLGDLLDMSMRAAKFNDSDRVKLRTAAFDFRDGTVVCPHCTSKGPHKSNNHHRFGKLTFVCIKCHTTFKSTEVTS